MPERSGGSVAFGRQGSDAVPENPDIGRKRVSGAIIMNIFQIMCWFLDRVNKRAYNYIDNLSILGGSIGVRRVFNPAK